MVCEVCEVFLSKVWCLWFSQKFGAIGLTMIWNMWNFPDFFGRGAKIFLLGIVSQNLLQSFRQRGMREQVC